MRHWAGYRWWQRKDGHHSAHDFSVLHNDQSMALSLCHKRKVRIINLIPRKAGTKYCKECEKRSKQLND